MYSIQDVRTAIKAKLDTLTWTGKPFSIAYDYFTTKPASFPCVAFEPVDLVSSFNSTCENERTYSFEIVILQEMTEKPRQDAIDIVLNAFNEVINAFDRDFELGGEVLKTEAVPWEFGEWVQDHWTTYYATIKLSCTVLYNIKT